MTPDEVRVGAWFRVETVGGFNYDGRHFSQGEVGIITNRTECGTCWLEDHRGHNAGDTCSNTHGWNLHAPGSFQPLALHQPSPEQIDQMSQLLTDPSILLLQPILAQASSAPAKVTELINDLKRGTLWLVSWVEDEHKRRAAIGSDPCLMVEKMINLMSSELRREFREYGARMQKISSSHLKPDLVSETVISNAASFREDYSRETLADFIENAEDAVELYFEVQMVCLSCGTRRPEKKTFKLTSYTAIVSDDIPLPEEKPIRRITPRNNTEDPNELSQE